MQFSFPIDHDWPGHGWFPDSPVGPSTIWTSSELGGDADEWKPRIVRFDLRLVSALQSMRRTHGTRKRTSAVVFWCDFMSWWTKALDKQIIAASFLTENGVLAQLVERLNGIEEVRGSNPLDSRMKAQVFAADLRNQPRVRGL